MPDHNDGAAEPAPDAGSVASKREAQQRADAIHSFRQELGRLEAQGVLVLSEEQRRSVNTHLVRTLAELAQRFDIDTTESQKQISVGMRLASTIGALALCAAVVLFFFRFWGLMTTPLQVGIVAATPVLLVLAAEYTSRRERTLYFTSLIVLVAFAAFILDLNVLGGIFNITPSPNAFLAWGLFALALAYRFSLGLPLVAGLVCLIVWLGGVITQAAGFFWGDMPARPEAFIAGGVLAIGAVLLFKHRDYLDFPGVYRLTGLCAIFFAMLFLSVKISGSYLPLSESNVAILYELLGMSLAAAAIWFGIKRGFKHLVSAAGAFFVLFLYCRLFQWWWDWMPKYLFFLIIGAISLGLLAVFQRVRKAPAVTAEEARI
jgi:uncharacterized membrane protein